MCFALSNALSSKKMQRDKVNFPVQEYLEKLMLFAMSNAQKTPKEAEDRKSVV